jgi:2-phospho-L-lactate transferase/gluconeogenesis factor (CofD/UPF0052 family)
MKILIFNGGRGASPLILNIPNNKDIHITSIVNAYDDGKSTGQIRYFFDMLGPSDLRKVQSLFLNKNDDYYHKNLDFFNYRLPEKINNQDAKALISKLFSTNIENLNNYFGLAEKVFQDLKKFIKFFLNKLNQIEKIKQEKFNFDDCSLMNCIYAGAFIYFDRDFLKTIKCINKIFDINHEVLPNSIENKRLIALRENGELLTTESDIVSLRSNVKIHKIYLINYKHKLDISSLSNLSFEKKSSYLNKISDKIDLIQPLYKKIAEADLIIYAPGTQHSSLLPSYLSRPLGDLIFQNKNSLKVFISNIGADYENPVYIASDYLINASKYINYSSSRNYNLLDYFNYLIINDPFEDFNKVKFDDGIKRSGISYIKSNFEDSQHPGHHDGKKLIKIIFDAYHHLKNTS